jgi:hypothetical protein
MSLACVEGLFQYFQIVLQDLYVYILLAIIRSCFFFKRTQTDTQAHTHYCTRTDADGLRDARAHV